MNTRERDWAQAMSAVRRGDAAAYERLLAEIAASLRPVVRAKLRHCGLGNGEAEDVVQEVLMAIHGKRHTWDEARPFTPWLQAIARHKLIDAARRLGREARWRRDVADGDWADLFEAPTVDPDRVAVDVERHVAALPGRQRDVVGALVLEGVSVRETAARLGTSEGVVRMTFHRALAAVRHAIDPDAAVLRGTTAATPGARRRARRDGALGPEERT